MSAAPAGGHGRRGRCAAAHRPGLRAWLLAAVALALVALAVRAEASSASPTACGSASAGVHFRFDNSIVRAIYARELNGPEVTADLAHVTGASDLVSAVANDDAAATLTAVTRIVYTPGWHIVRLRVLDSSGRVLADVGGPTVLAPVSGKLVSGGTVVGSFLMSVQDDRGYGKLVSHLVGTPIVIYRDDTRVYTSITNPPSSLPGGPTLTIGTTSYDVDAFNLEAFPSGTLRAVVLIAPPSPTLAAKSCAAVRLQSAATVAANIAIGVDVSGSPFLTHPSAFVGAVLEWLPSPTAVFVMRGRTEVAGSNEQIGSTYPRPPKTLPRSGSVSYDSAHWLVTSLEPFRPDRIYVLEPA
jgi:hypothetical protein